MDRPRTSLPNGRFLRLVPLAPKSKLELESVRKQLALERKGLYVVNTCDGSVSSFDAFVGRPSSLVEADKARFSVLRPASPAPPALLEPSEASGTTINSAACRSEWSPSQLSLGESSSDSSEASDLHDDSPIGVAVAAPAAATPPEPAAPVPVPTAPPAARTPRPHTPEPSRTSRLRPRSRTPIGSPSRPPTARRPPVVEEGQQLISRWTSPPPDRNVAPDRHVAPRPTAHPDVVEVVTDSD